MTRASTEQSLDQALTRLLAGQPTITDGTITVSNLCLEAGVGRDSFYRCPTIKQKFTAAKANAEARKPETLQLRDEVLALRQAQKTLRREHTEQVRDLETTIRAYANQIQTLALRNNELTDENTRLRHHLEQQDTNVTKLPQRD
jgi:chromosome segregation ATPase